MCGIAGKIDFAGPVRAQIVDQMCAAMEHRGPNERGLWQGPGVVLGMQRLAIIDVAGGSQPIFNEDRSVAVVMNGEIYNYRELRDELRASGHTLATQSDTEVLVHLYEECGERLVDRLRGMFAFALWDVRSQRLLLGRDRVGKKPLFFARRGSRISFASELMALLQDPEVGREPDDRAIASYFALQYVPHPLSAIVGVEKLRPASTLTVTAAGISERIYWQLDYTDAPVASRSDDLEERLRQLIWDATKVRMVSEVPLGAALSGGVDSSAVVAAMAQQTAGQVKTFSIGFTDEDYDELRYARMVSDRYGTDHHELVVEPHALEIMPRLARHYGEPFADSSAVPSFYLAEMMSQHVTVALNGDGGDESFAGYGRYVNRDPADHFDRVPLRARRRASRLASLLGRDLDSNSKRARAQRLAERVGMSRATRYAEAMSAFPARLRAQLFQPEFLEGLANWRPESSLESCWQSSSGQTVIERMLDTDVQTYLPDDLLVKMDIATMAHSVEGRSPLLDHHLMEFAASLPASLKLRGANGKHLLKAALRRDLPPEILDRRKMGFGVPLRRWFRDELRELPREVLLASDARVHRYVKPSAIEWLISEHQGGRYDQSLRLWVLLQLEFWHREVLESPLPSGDPVRSRAFSDPGDGEQRICAG